MGSNLQREEHMRRDQLRRPYEGHSAGEVHGEDVCDADGDGGAAQLPQADGRESRWDLWTDERQYVRWVRVRRLL